MVAKSDIDQLCSVIATRTDLTTFDIVPLTQFVANQKETFAPNTHQDQDIIISSLDADPIDYFYVTITYQDFTI